MARSGEPLAALPIVAWTREPGDLPLVPGKTPKLGNPPDASTEVVMADDEFFAAVAPVCWTPSSPTSLIPVLVTGIQPPRVRAVNDLFARTESFPLKDLGGLHSCDKHRNEGVVDCGAFSSTSSSPLSTETLCA